MRPNNLNYPVSCLKIACDLFHKEYGFEAKRKADTERNNISQSLYCNQIQYINSRRGL